MRAGQHGRARGPPFSRQALPASRPPGLTRPKAHWRTGHGTCPQRSTEKTHTRHIAGSISLPAPISAAPVQRRGTANKALRQCLRNFLTARRSPTRIVQYGWQAELVTPDAINIASRSENVLRCRSSQWNINRPCEAARRDAPESDPCEFDVRHSSCYLTLGLTTGCTPTRSITRRMFARSPSSTKRGSFSNRTATDS